MVANGTGMGRQTSIKVVNIILEGGGRNDEKTTRRELFVALYKKFWVVDGNGENPGQKLFDPGGGFNPETYSREKTGETFLPLST